MRVALIGLGRISDRHIDAITGNHNLTLVGVCDIDEAKYNANPKVSGIPFYASYYQMISDLKPDLVAVLTDSGSHYQIGMDLAKLGVHTLIEKPIALSVSHAEELISIFAKENRKLFVVKQNRFNEPMRKLKGAIASGELGELFLCNVSVHWCRGDEYYNQASWRGKWSSDGGVVANQAIHHIDAMLWLMGDIKYVSSFNGTFGSDIEVDDTNVSIAKFVSGALGTIETTTATRPANKEGSITVQGSKGTVKVGGHALNHIEYWRTFASEINSSNDQEGLTETGDVYGSGHLQLYKEIYNHLEYSHPTEIFGSIGRKSLEVVASLYLSGQLGRIVHIGEDTSEINLGRL